MPQGIVVLRGNISPYYPAKRSCGFSTKTNSGREENYRNESKTSAIIENFKKRL